MHALKRERPYEALAALEPPWQPSPPLALKRRRSTHPLALMRHRRLTPLGACCLAACVCTWHGLQMVARMRPRRQDHWVLAAAKGGTHSTPQARPLGACG